jgi:alkanesulfonate monooxygenase
MNPAIDPAIEVFSTCPPSSTGDPATYLARAVQVAEWSEQAGCKGILVYSDNSQLDAWSVSHAILQKTRTLSPLVAVQPIYMHPYTVAKTLASIAALWRRRLYLNMVAGGFKNDLTALNDTTPHDSRYDRLAEYTLIIRELLEHDRPVTFRGDFYQVENLRMAPPVAPELAPGILISGSSAAGLAAATRIGATAIKYPKPAEEEEPSAAAGLRSGIRVGVIARRTAAKAWEVAHARFPEDRKGQITRQLATKVSDSVWHKQLSDRESDGSHAGDSLYWLVPFNNYHTMCPYLVGSYEEVATEMARHFANGSRTVILDVPPAFEELQHTFAAFALALQTVH